MPTDKYKELPGLPGTGPPALPFPSSGPGYSEGYVVEFYPEAKGAWVGNFGRGGSCYDTVMEHPNGQHLIVFAGGQGYVIDPKTRMEIDIFGGYITLCSNLSDDPSMLVFVGLFYIEILDRWATVKRTEKISWDGMRNIRLEGDRLYGEAWDLNDSWVPFEVNLRDATHVGGSFRLHREVRRFDFPRELANRLIGRLRSGRT